MIANIEIDSNNTIISYRLFPFDKSKLWVVADKIYVGYSKYINGSFVLNEEAFANRDINIALKKELEEIQQWFLDNDWKVNKIVVGEWTTEDNRWIEYLEERTIKRNRQDELKSILEV